MKKIKNLNTNWRKAASTIYKKPIDSKIYGQVDLDVTDLEQFVNNKREEGLKITLTHIFVLLISRGLKTEVPELNAYIRRGKVIARPSVDAMVSVLKSNGEMSSIKVPDADTMNLETLANFMNNEILKSRKGDENSTMQSKNILSAVPWPFRNWVFSIYKTLTITWGINTPGLGIKSDSFGSFVLTNIGSIGLDTGYPALLPSSNVAFVLVMGGIKKKPVVINDQIVIRRIMSVSVVMDHRVVDASHAGRMLQFFKSQIKTPEVLE